MQIIEQHSIKIYQEKKLSSDLKSNMYIDVSKKENLKPLNVIDIGTKAKLMFTNSTFFPDEKQTKFRKDCLKFYVAAVQHLQSKLPLDIPFIKHAQFLHPKKHSTISNLALSICSVHKTCLEDVFLTKLPVTPEEVCDMVRNQWLVYQNEIIPEEWYKNLEESSQSPCSSKNQNSYRKEVESEFGLESQNLLKYYKRIDHYWRQSLILGMIKEL